MRDNRFSSFKPRPGGGSFSRFGGGRRPGGFSNDRPGYTPRPRMQVFDPLEKEFPRNNAITTPEVRVVGAKGENLGVMVTKDAIAQAENEEIDLILIAPQAKPPVCKMIAWESFRYQHKKKVKEMRKHQKTIKVKEIKVSPKIAGMDLERKIDKIHEVTAKGDQAKITIMRRWPVTEEAARKFKDIMLTKLDESCTIISIQEKGKNIFILVKSKSKIDAKT
ncbi:translation initiation factor IF-3 [Candidatus Dojkabacteria bacterium CG_4_9_14_3_um_filter_150_Dojkabacteria_WS6_41_13]|uniref:Translation initiation factor IF-3 n=1 Tax=Candidatus Dojkabacteria bacterium CG_4_10_14_0_2_um_filter_Dojkabacteria_WS6_41_15 TaxID=2014249 RepID=A0A2M7W152_9BACT|nr:MAG: translation initiation factor IF-3 [Candidatus Dojkabacteria bacterium CG_4_10_14_0_2_um_filter_Dojkabacteria_WS6_41_15]PJB22902.1 MAG: translation initiation factor IF-3 [Candidatus Dojkabacteria bacterium CG_4_9_14_3_um_filter_150_Dojkabacteria_WS6_41_13]